MRVTVILPRYVMHIHGVVCTMLIMTRTSSLASAPIPKFVVLTLALVPHSSLSNIMPIGENAVF